MHLQIAQVRSDRIRELFGRPGTPVYAPPILLAYLAVQTGALIWWVGDRPRILVWIALMLLVEFGFGMLLRRFHHRAPPDSELPAWARARVQFETIHGAAWASSAFLLHRPGEPVTLLSVMVTLAGLATANAASLAVHTPSAIAFVIGALAPAAVILMLRQVGQPEIYAAIMLLTTLIAVIANAVRMASVYDEGIRLRLDLGQQVEERKALQEAAEESSAERNRFFGAASHDLRQPVHALGLYASLLRQDPPARERRELIANVIACVDSLERLFNAILAVSRASEPDGRRPMTSVGLQEVIDRVVLQLRPQVEARGLRLRAPRTRVRVQADPEVLERILTNLLSNAIRYTEAGGVLVGVRRAGPEVRLVVADTGIGLGEEDQQRIFEPFYQVGLPQRDREQGFGLGLATVSQLCRTYDYGLSVRSKLTRGALFQVSLPRSTAPASRPAPEVTPDPPVLDRLTVLLVEDDRLVADAVRRILEAWDVQVHMCSSGKDGLALLEQRPPRERWHALLDYRLPGELTGLQLAEEIRRRHSDAVRVTLITGEADPGLFEAAAARGFVVLQKPLRPIRLRALLSAEPTREFSAP
jgi:signal transduction histidine kinase